MNVDELTGVELRKAVAEAVGWTWVPHPSKDCQYARDETNNRVHFQADVTWGSAIAACEAAGVPGDGRQIVFSNHGVEIQSWNPRYDWWETVGSPPHSVGDRSPEGLCRALLRFLEAKVWSTTEPLEAKHATD